MSDNGQRAPLPGCMIGPSEPCDAFQRQTARIAELEAALAAERERRGSSSPEDIARRFHDAYERLAPQFGYSTRPESRREWDELPQNLRDLMIAVVRNVLIEQPAADAD